MVDKWEMGSRLDIIEAQKRIEPGQKCIVITCAWEMRGESAGYGYYERWGMDDLKRQKDDEVEWKGCLGSGYMMMDVNGYEGVGSGHVKHWISTWVQWLKEW